MRQARHVMVTALMACLVMAGEARGEEAPQARDRAVAKSRTAPKKQKRPATKPIPANRGDHGQKPGIAPAPFGTPLSLADAVAIGLRDNRTIRAAYISRVAQKFDLRVMENRFTPKFALRGSTNYQQVSGFGTSNLEVAPTIATLLPTGATFGFSWLNTASLSTPLRQQGSVAEISLVQPLLRGGGVDVNMAPVRNARLAEQMNRLRLKATVSETIGQIIFAYRTLLQAQEELKLAHNSVIRAKNLLEVNKSLIEAGRMAAMDIVQTEADLENQNIRVLESTKSLENARLKLLSLLSLDLSAKIIAQESTAPAEIRPAIAQLIPIALAQRPDFVGQQIVIQQNRLGITVAENEQLWDLSLFASGKFGDRKTYGAVSSTHSVADFTVGLNFSVPIGDIRKEQPLVHANSALRISELHLGAMRQAIELQLRSSIIDITIRWRQIEAARRARDLAARAMETEKEKLKVGRSSNFQVKAMENDLRTAESQHLNAVIGYLNALTLLDIELGTALSTWRIDLND